MLTDGLMAEILESSRSIHDSGSLSPAALIALAKRLETRKIQRSAETGTGASTLIFSHLSECHTVFALDPSVSQVLGNPSLHAETTTFVRGPTQKTLPAYSFREPLQAVLLDGPHAYPFPDLEYFYLYPQLEKDALLIIDDIHIPSIQNLFRVVSRDDMFQLVEVCGKTAFLRRTEAPLFDPWDDGWWLQGFNKRTLWRYSWQDRLKTVVPGSARLMLRRRADRLRLWLRRRGSA